MALNLKVPKILSIISSVLLLLGLLLGLVVFSQADSPEVKDLISEFYSTDPTIQANLEAEDLTFEEFQTGFISTMKGFISISLIATGIALLLNVIGVFIMKKAPRAAAVMFIIIGVLSILTVVIPALLITAGIMIFVKRSKHLNNENTIQA
ncbi:DUF4064 domain-containing protein [Metabacillus malikii]|uniref:Lipopolysaccharide export LptBFGC system permease protein LptF n=1 Tax=Metabacillus malikii TaxID=1504265 RepID=A0ABT9ZKF6_9BACI|nr:DUF4064 domain-containing protein [Metabacillus malikii]MDQ0232023.1 lipopolysaccharide export LptBFGC system permease protein LptF [Metabacillus malikii]